MTFCAAGCLVVVVVSSAVMWEDASYKLHGNLFWPDFWPAGTNADAQDVVYDLVGLEPEKAAVRVMGKTGRV